jgi:hypothetical protein
MSTAGECPLGHDGEDADARQRDGSFGHPVGLPGGLGGVRSILAQEAAFEHGWYE